MRDKHRALIRFFKTLFGKRHRLQRHVPKIRRRIKLHFDGDAQTFITPLPDRLLGKRARRLIRLPARRTQSHFRAEPKITRRQSFHIVNAVNHFPALRAEQRHHFFDRHFIPLRFPPNRAGARKTDLRMLLTAHDALIPRVDEIPLLAVLAADELRQIRIRMKEMVQEARAPVPIHVNHFFEILFFNAHNIVDGLGRAGTLRRQDGFTRGHRGRQLPVVAFAPRGINTFCIFNLAL